MSRLEEFGVIESETEYVITSIEEATVEEMCFSYTFEIRFDGELERSFKVTTDLPFRFFIDGSWQVVNPKNLSTCHSILKLHKDIVIESSVLKSGEMRIVFKSGAKLILGADDYAESWQFSMSTRYEPDESWLMKCMPGGEILVS